MRSTIKANPTMLKVPPAAIIHGFFVSLILLAICAVLLLLGLRWNFVRADMLGPIYLYGIYAAVFLGGLLAARNVHGHGWFVGLVFGFVFFILTAVMGRVWEGSAFPLPLFFLRWLTMMAVGALAGMIGVNL